jgi:putative sigma-54 modulation protein
MQVTVSSRHTEVTPPLRSYAEQKAEKLIKYYDRINDVEVVVDTGNDMMSVEMIVHDEHRHKFLAHCKDADAYACVDKCFAKLERQLSEHKKKLRNRKHQTDDKHEMA